MKNTFHNEMTASQNKFDQSGDRIHIIWTNLMTEYIYYLDQSEDTHYLDCN